MAGKSDRILVANRIDIDVFRLYKISQANSVRFTEMEQFF